MQGIFSKYKNFISEVPYNSKKMLDNIIKGKLSDYLNRMDFSDDKLKFSIINSIEDNATLHKFLQLDQSSKQIQESFLMVEDSLKDQNQDKSLIMPKYEDLVKDK